MKTSRLNFLAKNVFLVLFTSIVAISFSSCAKKVVFQNSAVAPAARGYIKLKKDKNNNYAIQIALSDLAESRRLQPPKETYVIWLVTDQDMTKNLGQVNTSKGLFSKKLKVSFKTVSSLKPAKIFITAEDDKSIQYPGGQVVLSTDRFEY